MNDLDAALLVLIPLDDHPIVGGLFQGARERGWIDFAAICATNQFRALSDGEQGLVRCAQAIYGWKPIPFDALGHMQKPWVHHVLGVFALRLGLDVTNGSPGLCEVTVSVPAGMHA